MMKKKTALFLAVAASGIALPLSASAQKNDHADPDRAVYGWYAGIPIFLFAATPSSYGGDGPDAPSDAYPDVTVYLHAPVTEEIAHGPAVNLPPGPDGEQRYLPPHMDTLPILIDEDAPHDAMGVFVIPGPTADAKSVRSMQVPANSVTGGPLVREIRVNGVWVPINNHVVIHWGLAQGLLATVPFDYGGIMWTSLPGRVPPERLGPPLP